MVLNWLWSYLGDKIENRYTQELEEFVEESLDEFDARIKQLESEITELKIDLYDRIETGLKPISKRLARRSYLETSEQQNLKTSGIITQTGRKVFGHGAT